MSDGHFDAPAYCELCNRPIPVGPLCAGCYEAIDVLDEETYEQRNRIIEVMELLTNGNLTAGIELMMSDPNPISLVSTALGVATIMVREQVPMDQDTGQHMTQVVGQLVGLIEVWNINR